MIDPHPVRSSARRSHWCCGVVHVAVSAMRWDRRQVSVVDAGVGSVVALAICSLVVAPEPATGVMVASLVVYGGVLASLVPVVSFGDRLVRFEHAPPREASVKPPPVVPVRSSCHRRPATVRRTSRARPPCQRVRSATRVAHR
jgi:hypothetical protein